MKRILIPALVLFGFACSAPKQYYMFNSTPSNVEKGKQIIAESTEPNEQQSPLVLQEQEKQVQVASVNTEVMPPVASAPTAPKVFSKEEYKNMSKAEKKATRKLIKKEIKNYIKVTRAKIKGEKVEATHDVTLTGYTRIGAILAAAGIVLMILTTGTVSQLGSLLVLIGVIFILVDIL